MYKYNKGQIFFNFLFKEFRSVELFCVELFSNKWFSRPFGQNVLMNF